MCRVDTVGTNDRASQNPTDSETRGIMPGGLRRLAWLLLLITCGTLIEANCPENVGIDPVFECGTVDCGSHNADVFPAAHQEKGSACWGTLFCMLTCKMTVLQMNMVASTVSDAKLHVATLCMLTCIRDVMHVNMHCCVCQHA